MSDTIEDGKFVELNYRVVDVKTGDTLVTVDYPLGYVHGVNDVMAEAVTKELYGKKSRRYDRGRYRYDGCIWRA
jgi:FKBP-type peptidyl-prolyl cis-trans isomerase SlyD